MLLTLARSLSIVPLLVSQLLASTTSPSIARTISWSGYDWVVRPSGSGGPGPNAWSDSPSNVRVQGRDLLLSIAPDPFGRWASAEIDNRRHLGYGTYRWIVATDLSALDANDVLGLFTYGGADASNNEIDIEPSHWGDLSTTGSATVWQNAERGLSEGRSFDYSSRPPYVNEFTWSPGRIKFRVTDGSGRTLLKWIVTNGVPRPSTEVPVINYWRFDNVAPIGVHTMRISGFAWAPLGRRLRPVDAGRVRMHGTRVDRRVPTGRF